MRSLWKEIRTSFLAVAAFSIVLCGIYPLAVWVGGRIFFPDKAGGSLILQNGTVIGSSLIGQPFSGPRYFHPRPSAAGAGYDAASSGGSNLGPLSKKLIETIAGRAALFRKENGLSPGTRIPADAVTSSGSGLDPHISVKNALLQAPRVAQARGMSEAEIRKRIAAHTRGRDLAILGQPRVNVLLLNLDLDGEARGGR